MRRTTPLLSFVFFLFLAACGGPSEGSSLTVELHEKIPNLGYFHGKVKITSESVSENVLRLTVEILDPDTLYLYGCTFLSSPPNTSDAIYIPYQAQRTTFSDTEGRKCIDEYDMSEIPERFGILLGVYAGGETVGVLRTGIGYAQSTRSLFLLSGE